MYKCFLVIQCKRDKFVVTEYIMSTVEVTIFTIRNKFNFQIENHPCIKYLFINTAPNPSKQNPTDISLRRSAFLSAITLTFSNTEVSEGYDLLHPKSRAPPLPLNIKRVGQIGSNFLRKSLWMIIIGSPRRFDFRTSHHKLIY